MCFVLYGNPVAETSSKKSPAHVGECEEKETAASKGIDGPHGGPGEDEIDETETEGCKESLLLGESTLFEDGGRVEGNDVD